MARTVSNSPAGAWIDADGKPTQQFLAFIQKIEKLANAAPDLSAVDTITPGNTSTATTTRSWNDSLNAVPGVDAGADPATLGNGGGTTVGDSFKKIANGLNALYLNTTNLDTSVDALNTRLVAIETAFEELRAALTA